MYSRLPNEICEKIYNYKLDLYILKLKEVHYELLNNCHYLNLSENIFDMHLDYMFAERLPALESLS